MCSGPIPPYETAILDLTYNQHYPLLREEYSAALRVPKEWKIPSDLTIKQLLHNPGVHPWHSLAPNCKLLWAERKSASLEMTGPAT
eukprot:11104899-Ditylum_brightwellii.AAC.1